MPNTTPINAAIEKASNGATGVTMVVIPRIAEIMKVIAIPSTPPTIPPTPHRLTPPTNTPPAKPRKSQYSEEVQPSSSVLQELEKPIPSPPLSLTDLKSLSPLPIPEEKKV